MSFLKKLEPFALVLLRCGLAVVFMYHGYPKLFGSTERFVESFQAIGLPPSVVYVAGAIEVFGGMALALGLLTPVVGLLLVLDMAGRKECACITNALRGCSAIRARWSRPTRRRRTVPPSPGLQRT
jgi:hypothetical protein